MRGSLPFCASSWRILGKDEGAIVVFFFFSLLNFGFLTSSSHYFIFLGLESKCTRSSLLLHMVLEICRGMISLVCKSFRALEGYMRTPSGLTLSRSRERMTWPWISRLVWLQVLVVFRIYSLLFRRCFCTWLVAWPLIFLNERHGQNLDWCTGAWFMGLNK